MTLTEAAKLTGYNREYLRRITQKGCIIAEKVGGTWVLDEQSLVSYMDRHLASGSGREGPRRRACGY